MTDSTLARRGHTDMIPAAPVQLRGLDDVYRLGKLLAASGYFSDVRDAAQAVAKILYGMELGVGPMGALMGIHVIEGKPSPSANLMATLIKKSRRYNYRVTTWTETECVIDFTEDGQPCGTASFTWKEADRITMKGRKLTSGANWQNYPKAMLFSRALAQGARAFCADVFGGAPVYTAEELGAPIDVTGEGDVIYHPPAPPSAPPPEQVDEQTGEILDGEATEIDPDAAYRPDLDHRLRSAVAAAGRDLEKVRANILRKHGGTWAALPLATLEAACEYYEGEAALVAGDGGAA